MKLPFEFGKLVEQSYFVNRIADKKRLKSNLIGGINTLLISPRRWGKSSLVQEVYLETKTNEAIFCFIDLFHIKNEKEFYETLAEEVIKRTFNQWDEWVKTAKEFFKSIRPKISMGIDPKNDFSLSFEAHELEKNYQELLNLAENIAKKKNIRIVICVDEFQNLIRFDDPLLFQQRLRASWQEHKNVTYCLVGCKRHFMMDIFQNKNMPFYKFGDVMYLEKIETDHWTKYIQQQFKKTDKSISKSLATTIVATVKNHSYYVQQFSLLCWYRTQNKCSTKEVQAAIADLIKQNAMLFNREIDGLSNTQISFLEALSQGNESFHSKAIIVKYNLGSSSNVSRIKEALEKKEIIDTMEEKIKFLDPVFEYWFKNNYRIKNKSK